jgi:hydroxymethylbilane synthase
LQSTRIRIGTRGSPLALVQAEAVRAALASTSGMPAEAIEIVIIRTTGDWITDRPLADAGGKGLFTKEIDEAMLDGRVDIGVHSAKDMATRLPEGVEIGACLPRGDPRDAFVSPHARTLTELPAGAIVGTSSLRRRALVLHQRPDLAVADLRGNVDTRVRKIEEGRAHATLLAAAGLVRLGLTGHVASYLDVDTWVPAPGQGTIAIAVRADDERAKRLVAALDDRQTALALAAERAFLAVLDGSCRTPIGGIARIDGDLMTFHGMIVKPDGSAAHDVTTSGRASDAVRIGEKAARDITAMGGADFFVGA